MRLRTIHAVAAAAAAISLAAPVSALAAHPLTKHDRQVIRFFASHPKQARKPAGQSALWSVLSHVVASFDRQTQSAWPTHHALWECIADNEGAWDAVNPNGHYGGLQMTSGWYGGAGHHASDDPQLVQERAAETAYAASGFSRSWLDGQWLRWDGAYYCLKYA